MKDIERWLKKGLIDENLAEILNTDLKEEAEKLANSLETEYEDIEFEVQYGGQPVYSYFVSVE